MINNAGIHIDRNVSSMDEISWNKVIETNLGGTFHFSKSVLPQMRKQQYGRIINIGSVVALTGSKGASNYSASKAGIIGFTKSFAKEVAPFGITVNTILTGGCKTDRLESLIKKNSKINKTKYTEQLKKLSAIVPVGHLATTEEFIQLILFLSTTNSSYINGSAIPVDGGVSRSIF